MHHTPQIKNRTDLVLFYYSVVIMFRFFKGFRGQPRIAVLLETFAIASVDFAHFFVIFLVVFLNYAVAGYVVYGIYLEEFAGK